MPVKRETHVPDPVGPLENISRGDDSKRKSVLTSQAHYSSQTTRIFRVFPDPYRAFAKTYLDVVVNPWEIPL